ncbi:NUDIX domain-containing protein [Pontibacter arcticus]|uniref:GDP-mannose pyrophosphatase n=1 Tax=Pontibacter arcticus TaxID=2080288 RepID=A0A364REN8_9BACT|nr:NUDIX hydrolase [Pontibacter arcticus]RAU82715.1 NUDIX hydrolase [Pontibacter arcticus]
MKIKRKETIYNGFYTFRKLIVEENGEEFEREQFDSGSAAAAIVYDTSRDLYLFVQQYRYSAQMEMLEIVAGVVEKDDPEKTIRKEIKEEIGYAVDKLEHIWDFYTSPGACTEKVYLYYAEVSQKQEEGGGLEEHHEHIKVKAFTFEELQKQKQFDAKTIIAVQWLAARNNATLENPEVTS